MQRLQLIYTSCRRHHLAGAQITQIERRIKMPRKNEDTNEIKPKYFRVDDETAAKIEQLSTEVFHSKNECLKALIQIYELEQNKKTMPGFATDIDNFRAHLSIIEESYLHLLQLNADGELRIREEYSLQLSTMTKNMAALQESLDTAKSEQGTYKELYREQRDLATKRYEELDKAYTSLNDKEKLVKMLETQIEESKKQLDSLTTELALKEERLAQLNALETENEKLQTENEHLEEQIILCEKQLEAEKKSSAEALSKTEAAALANLEQALKNANFEKEKALFELNSKHQDEINQLKQQHLQQMQELIQKGIAK